VGEGRLDPVRLFFASTGRMGRLAFLPAIAVVVGLFAAYEAAVRGPAHLATAWLVHLVLLFSGVSLLSKRLHDRGRSGWWSAPILLAFVVVWPRPAGVADWLFAAVLAWAAVELALAPGRPGANRFGPRP